MNHVTLSGTVTRDCYVRDFTGSSVINFTVACNEKYKTKDGTIKEKAHFIDCTRFTSDPEYYKSVCQKGNHVFVDGSLAQESWTDKKTNEKKSVIRVKAEHVLLIPSKRTASAAPKQDAPSESAGNDAGTSADGETMPF